MTATEARDRSPAATLEAFGAALGRRDFDRMAELLDPQVRFRALIPDGLREAVGPESVIRWYREWFGAADEHRSVKCEAFEMADRVGLRWRGRRRLSREDQGPAWYLVEQDFFADVGPNGIETLALVCSGDRPEPGERSAAAHEFDAGDLGCSDGLPQEFKRRVRAIPVGDRLRVIARDPAAKQDLPPLARMMGHSVESVEDAGDGRVVFTVERRV